MAAPKILFTIGGLHPEFGGPSQSVPALVIALERAGVGAEIVSQHYGRAWQPPVTAGQSVRSTYVDCSSALAQRLQWSPRFRAALKERCQAMEAQVIHDTGLWLLTNHAAASVSRELRLPRIVSPRGMLTDWALRHKGFKKRIAWALYQRRDLCRAQVLHATSPREAENFRAAGLSQPIAVIPNGVELPPAQNAPSETRNSQRKTLLFLGRIHPVKGLLDLVEAWAKVRRPDWRVVIAGGDEMDHRAEVEAAIRAWKLGEDFQFAGSVAGPAKWDWYRQADLFILPSRSENFGLVVAEALAAGVPVVTTRGTPWENLQTHQCGWWVANGVEPLAAALGEALALPEAVRRAMGLRGRKFVEEKFSWPVVAAQMHDVYRWMLGGGGKPATVLEN